VVAQGAALFAHSQRLDAATAARMHQPRTHL
jgi:hypothetical protein